MEDILIHMVVQSAVEHMQYNTGMSVLMERVVHKHARTFRHFHRKNIFSEKQSQFFFMTSRWRSIVDGFSG